MGERLREMFETMTAGPAPDHLVDLVDQLEAQQQLPIVVDIASDERACLTPA